MAITQLNDPCIFCKTKIDAETNVTMICKVNATKRGRSGPGDCGISFGGTFKEVKKDKLRIRHLVGGKPRGFICDHCLKKITDYMEQRIENQT